MFTDALVESRGTIRTKSRYWMIATFTFNLSVFTTAMLVPLIYPETLSHAVVQASLFDPKPPDMAKPVVRQQVERAATHAAAPLDPLIAPTHPPTRIDTKPDAPPLTDGRVMTSSIGDVVGGPVLSGVSVRPMVVVAIPPKPAEKVHVSNGVMAGQLLSQTPPLYPSIARAAGVSGSVVLHAVISKAGGIEQLAVVSGPEMLRAAALEAVKTWRYRPYLLNGEPTEVDTTVTVNFRIGG